MRTISGECPNCDEPFTLKYKSKLLPHTGSCNQCGTNWSSKGTPLESCSFCGCRYFYRQKDFNHLLGCGIVILGGFIVPAIIGYVIGYRYFLIITICSFPFSRLLTSYYTDTWQTWLFVMTADVNSGDSISLLRSNNLNTFLLKGLRRIIK